MKSYNYKYIEGIALTSWDIEEILRNIDRDLKKFEVVVDLGLRKVEVEVLGDSISIDSTLIDLNIVRDFKEGFVYKVINGEVRRLDMYSNGKYYKLRAVARDKAPTIEINGIHMHRIHGLDPWSDSILKIRAIGRKIKNARVLDICTGLGYTAIAEVMFGAESVTTIDIDENVLFFASMNPWSRGLENPRIEIILGDAVEVLDYINPGEYDVVVHDPPRFEVAGELYSLDFYRKIYEVLRKGGILIHYTGNPGKHSNIDILKGIKSRLAKAGFEEVKWIEAIQGFKAIKRY
jgi:predicted methyltransferase